MSTEVFRSAAARSPRMFWLDGGGARYRSEEAPRWSDREGVLGVLADDDVSLSFDAGKGAVTRHQSGRDEVVGDDIFAVLADELARDGGDPAVSWVGYLGYACRRDLPGRPASGVPDAVWMRVREPELHPLTEPGPAARRRARAEMSDDGVPDWYADAYDAVQRELYAGNSYEVNLTYRESMTSQRHPADAYVRLRDLNPAPYSGYLQHHGVHLLSSSPERFATVDRNRVLEAKPIKGTTPRSRDAVEDAELRRVLATDPKYRAENLMIVDLLRNDLSMVCEAGSVEVPSLMEVESFEAVHQLVSTVRGQLRDDVSTIAALQALFPAGSMTGAPKRRTMAIIDEVEGTPRGVYAGAFGWVSGDGRADLSVVIRSLVARPDGGSSGWTYEWGTGGGVTVKSDPVEEYAETRWKADRLRVAP